MLLLVTVTSLSVLVTTSKAQYVNCLSLFSKSLQTGMQGGERYRDAYHETECQAICALNASCIAVDWNFNTVPGFQCWKHYKPGKKYRSAYIKHYHLNRSTPCRVDCIFAFVPTPDMSMRGGVLLPDVDLLEDCKQECISDTSCIGINFNPSGGDERTCFVLSTVGEYFNISGVTNYMFNRSACHVNCELMFKPTWNTRMSGGVLQDMSNTMNGLLDCIKACIKNLTCTGLNWSAWPDYDEDSDNYCWLLFGVGEISNSTEFHHYSFNRSTCDAWI